MAALSDGSKVVVSAVPGYRESTRSWSEVLRDLRDRPQLPQAGGRGRTPGDRYLWVHCSRFSVSALNSSRRWAR